MNSIDLDRIKSDSETKNPRFSNQNGAIQKPTPRFRNQKSRDSETKFPRFRNYNSAIQKPTFRDSATKKQRFSNQMHSRLGGVVVWGWVITFLGDGTWVLNHSRLGGVVVWGWVITFLGDGTWVLNHSRLGGVVVWGWVITFLGDGTWVLNHSRLGGVVGWGWANNVPGRWHLGTEWGGGMGLGQ